VCDIITYTIPRCFGDKYKTKNAIKMLLSIASTRTRIQDSKAYKSYILPSIFSIQPELSNISDMKKVVFMFLYDIEYDTRYEYLDISQDGKSFYHKIPNITITKIQHLEHIILNMYIAGQLKNNIIKFKLFFGLDRYKELENIISHEQIYLFLKGDNSESFCKCCGTKLDFIKYTEPYNITCSNVCKQKLYSVRMKEDNPVYKLTEEMKIQINKTLSTKLKAAIAEGRFTPNVTNYWSNSRIYVNDVPLRSAWEAYFHIFNMYKFEYETVRIPYINEAGIKRTYIVDFVDTKERKLYEIKPEENKSDILTKIKEEAAIIWSKENGYTYEFISNDWFKINYNKNKIINCKDLSDGDREKLLNRLKQFE